MIGLPLAYHAQGQRQAIERDQREGPYNIAPSTDSVAGRTIFCTTQQPNVKGAVQLAIRMIKLNEYPSSLGMTDFTNIAVVPAHGGQVNGRQP